MTPNYGGGRNLSSFILPPTIRVLLLVNAVVFLLQEGILPGIPINGTTLKSYFLYYSALWPIESNHFYVWQLITYQFMHADVMHILFNMLMLWVFGSELENTLGWKRFLTIY
ncbi:MAG: rhomboid family intramembrane serine protease, partial [Candidatus Kapabacteria bacterium]|nr:rhomboid family intramembrane serine protease [Candidatus Kapabacteria bacterium]